MTEVTIGPGAGSGVFQVMVESPAGQVTAEVGLDLELLPVDHQPAGTGVT
jgi:hypothetical protein